MSESKIGSASVQPTDLAPRTRRSVADVRRSLIERREIAILDVREEGPFAEAHPLFAASLPFSRLELEVLERIPSLSAPIVVYDGGEGLAPRAIQKLRAIGYRNVAALDGGLEAWRAAGAELFRDVNAPSKAFGELVESVRHTPSISAEELQEKLRAGADMVVLDARRFDEYNVMSIPSATSVPGGELVLRVRQQAPNPDTLVVVNCAGRTRSIVGTQSLINAAIPNRVTALRNGTIGWTLAGLPLERGQARRHQLSGSPAAETREAAASLATRTGVGRVDWETLAVWVNDDTRTVYRFDVRTPEEYVTGHPPSFRSAPGGQLVQETDVFAPVRGARLVLSDDDDVRARMTASWLAQMGWDVYVLSPQAKHVPAEAGAPPLRVPPLPPVLTISARELAQHIPEGKLFIVDLASRADYQRGHLPGAFFALRSQLENALHGAPSESTIVLVSPDGVLATFAAADLDTYTGRRPLVLAGGTHAWISAELHLESGTDRFLAPAIDRYKRPYEGTDHPREAMQAYLDWEYGLVAQLGRDQTHHFRVL